MNRLHIVGILFVCFLLNISLAHADKLLPEDDQIAFHNNCKYAGERFRQRFIKEIDFIKKKIMSSVSNGKYYKNIPIVLDCSGNEFLAYSGRKGGEDVVYLGAGLLDILERLSYLLPLELLGEKKIIDKYPSYLAREILIKNKKLRDIDYPLKYASNAVTNKYTNNSFMEEARIGAYFGMIAYVLGHEYGHIRLKHLEKGIRTNTPFPRNKKEERIFQSQEYLADLASVMLLRKLKLPSAVGIIVNQYLINANAIKPNSILQSHPPAYLRSVALATYAISEADNLYFNPKDQKRYRDVLKRFKNEFAERAYANLGEHELKRGLDKGLLNNCLDKRQKGCMGACSKYGNSHSDCKNRFCSSKRQYHHDLVMCHLEIQR